MITGEKMLEKIIKFLVPLIMIFAVCTAHADSTLFSTNLHAKFQVKACTHCHDFYEKDKNGLSFNSHAKRLDVNRCQMCHKSKVTSFEHPEEWFARPGLYTSGMSAKESCETIKEALHAKFKSDNLLAGQMKKHLFEDPRVLWGIEGGLPNSGKLPFKKQEVDLIKGGMEEWKAQVTDWINGGMKCD